MELNPIQSYSYTQSTAVSAAEKKTVDAPASASAGKYGKDTVEISADASFKSELSTYSKNLASKELVGASEKRIAELSEKYKGDSCPVSSSDIASAIMGYTFGKTAQE